MSNDKQKTLLKIQKEVLKKIKDTFLEEAEEIKISDYKGDILLWASYGTILASINTTGAMNVIKPIAVTICFGILSIEVVDAIKTGKLVKDFNHITSNKQFRKVR